MAEPLSKKELILRIHNIAQQGWVRSVKDKPSDAAVGNTLERLLGITENNLPIPNAQEWELKAQRKTTNSLITLKHIEPSPRGCKVVTELLLPNYGWAHKEAGKKYPVDERSFRQTLRAGEYTNRGFTIVVDRDAGKIRVVFHSEHADLASDEIRHWLDEVKARVGLAPLSPEPFWAFGDLDPLIAAKMRNCFYVVADTKIEQGCEQFKYESLYVLSSFSFERFLQAVESGDVLVDFDARTGHNHGTKFRLRQGAWPKLYDEVKCAFAPDKPLALHEW